MTMNTLRWLLLPCVVSALRLPVQPRVGTIATASLAAPLPAVAATHALAEGTDYGDILVSTSGVASTAIALVGIAGK
jgi:hypothetical protein